MKVSLRLIASLCIFLYFQIQPSLYALAKRKRRATHTLHRNYSKVKWKRRKKLTVKWQSPTSRKKEFMLVSKQNSPDPNQQKILRQMAQTYLHKLLSCFDIKLKKEVYSSGISFHFNITSQGNVRKAQFFLYRTRKRWPLNRCVQRVVRSMKFTQLSIPSEHQMQIQYPIRPQCVVYSDD